MWGLQQLLSVLYKHSTHIDITCNNKKTVCMVFKPKLRAKRIAYVFRNLALVLTYYSCGHSKIARVCGY